MRQVEFVPFRLTDVAEIFSIKIGGKEYTELQEFIITFRNVTDDHLQAASLYLLLSDRNRTGR